MPQVARSMGYPTFLVAQSIEAYAYLVFCIFLHAAILLFVAKEEEVVYGFGGEMHLCDYGIGIENCPDAPGCIGPGGTNYTSTPSTGKTLHRLPHAGTFPETLKLHRKSSMAM